MKLIAYCFCAFLHFYSSRLGVRQRTSQVLQWFLLSLHILSRSGLVDGAASVSWYGCTTVVGVVLGWAQVGARESFYIPKACNFFVCRFITSNIRNQIDYSPQLIYWLGAELEKSGQFEWTDDTRMSFQVWKTDSLEIHILFQTDFTIFFFSRAGYPVRVNSKNCLQTPYVWVCNGRCRQRQCYHRACIGNHKNAVRSAVMCAKSRRIHLVHFPPIISL